MKTLSLFRKQCIIIIILIYYTLFSLDSTTKLWSLKVPAWFLYKVIEFMSLEHGHRTILFSKKDKHFIPSLFICRTLYNKASI